MSDSAPGPPPHRFNREDFDAVDLMLTSAAPPSTEQPPPQQQQAPSAETVRHAHQELERRLILDATEAASSSSSGTTGLGFENIVGVGITNKVIAGQETPLRSVTVYVIEKGPPEAVVQEAQIPRAVASVPTDVVATGELLALAARGRFRPSPAGVSVSHYQGSAGTLGCLVRRKRSLFILSNNHVLALVNRGAIGDVILQPGPADGGSASEDVIARLAEYIPLRFDGSPNLVDCAIAQTDPALVNPSFCFGGVNTTSVPCTLNMLVKKCGRLTGFTLGRVTDCNASLRIRYENNVALFQGQMVIQSISFFPFAGPSDSGSLIVSNDFSQPVGLLFAGSATHTVASPIDGCLSALNVAIV